MNVLNPIFILGLSFWAIAIAKDSDLTKSNVTPDCSGTISWKLYSATQHSRTRYFILWFLVEFVEFAMQHIFEITYSNANLIVWVTLVYYEGD